MKSKTNDLTPVTCYGKWWAKREDTACEISPDQPSGCKMRQFLKMAAAFPKGTPLVVGCSASSAMQVYLTAAAIILKAKSFIFLPARAEMTPTTKWCMAHGAGLNFIRPGYPAVYRLAARNKAKELGGCVRWDRNLAAADVMEQVQNLPTGVRRIIVPTGSGLIAASVAAGLIKYKRTDISILAVSTSVMVKDAAKIIEMAAKICGTVQPVGLGILKALVPLDSVPVTIKLIRTDTKYETAVAGSLPDGALLDPYYAAKALPFVRAGDCLWVVGRRPVGPSFQKYL